MPGARDDSEAVAYWFFRLNGFLTIRGFIVHPDQGSDQRTDADIIGVRFPYRRELLPAPMPDAGAFTSVDATPLLVLAEVKQSGKCRLNGPWTDANGQNIHRVLRAIGAIPDPLTDEVAEKLYNRGMYEDRSCRIALACVAKRTSNGLSKRYPDVLQFTWEDIARFIYCRFRDYRQPKASHPQWDQTGQDLWNEFELADTRDAYAARIIERIGQGGIRTAPASMVTRRRR